MGCEGSQKTLVQAIADALYKDESGNVFLNTSILRVDCESITPLITCGHPDITNSIGGFLGGEDDCENPTIQIGLPIEDTESDPIILKDAVWDDLRAPANGINPVGSLSPATPNTTDGSLTFGKGNVVAVWFQMPHHWKEGTDLHVHIHWSKQTTNNGIVKWQMKYKWANIGDVMPAFSALSDGTEVIPNSDTVDKHALLEWTPIDGNGKTLSSMLCVYLVRTAAGDTFTGDVNLYEIDIHYQIDSLGSTSELIK